jgi:hypothetical protein
MASDILSEKLLAKCQTAKNQIFSTRPERTGGTPQPSERSSFECRVRVIPDGICLKKTDCRSVLKIDNMGESGSRTIRVRIHLIIEMMDWSFAKFERERELA